MVVSVRLGVGAGHLCAHDGDEKTLSVQLNQAVSRATKAQASLGAGLRRLGAWTRVPYRKGKIPGPRTALTAEMVGDAEHEEIGAVVGGDVGAIECKVSEVVLVLDKGGDFRREIIFHAG